MIDISVFLARYTQGADTFRVEKETLAAIIQKTASVTVPTEAIVVGKNKVSINVSGSKKAALFLKRGLLEKEFTSYFASVTEVR